MKIIYLIILMIFMEVTSLGGDPLEIPFEKSYSRYFINKITYNFGKLLDRLELNEIESKSGAVVARCTVLEESSARSIEVVFEGKVVEVRRTVTTQSGVRSDEFTLTAQEGSAKTLLDAIKEIQGQEFWVPLTDIEVDFFSSINGGKLVGFEIWDGQKYRFVAVVEPSIALPKDLADKIRPLDKYDTLMNIFLLVGEK